MESTFDPYVSIEERGEGYIRYRNAAGRRWEVHGVCDHRGDCLIGAVIDGFGVIESHEDIEAAKKKLGTDRLLSEMDVPVTPEFDSCCGGDIFRYVELEQA